MKIGYSFLKGMSFDHIFVAVKENNTWRSLYNHEVYNKYEQSNILSVIKSYRIRWLGHVFRRKDSDPVKKMTFLKIEGTRRRRRPVTRWLVVGQCGERIEGVGSAKLDMKSSRVL